MDVVSISDYAAFIFGECEELSYSDFFHMVSQFRGSKTVTCQDIMDLRKYIVMELTLANRGLEENVFSRIHEEMYSPAFDEVRTENVAAAMEMANDAWHKPLNLLREAFNAQQQLIEGLVNEVRDSGNQLSEVLACACAKASEATASENVENSERLAVIDAATASAAGKLPPSSPCSSRSSPRTTKPT